jgi:hypothetical protein
MRFRDRSAQTDPAGAVLMPAPGARDRHLFGPGPKRILAIDGGGVRAAITLSLLEKIEEVLAARAGHPVRLCDYFDLIGGTSSGAVTAGGLALGLSTAQLRDIYVTLWPKAFRPVRWRIRGLQPKFDGRAVARDIRAIIGERTLDTSDLQTGLAIVMKRIDTGSPWVISNNPRARFWETPQDRSYIGNRHFPLVNLIRASTAAPTYFDPELVPIVEGEPPGLFVDGGLTPHKNPALQMLLMALLDGYALNWEGGADRLLLVSIGTGHFRQRFSAAESARMTAAGLAVRALTGLILDTDALAVTLLHWLAGAPSRWPLNAELGTLAGQKAPFGTPLLTFRRYDVQLEADWLASELGLAVDPRELQRLRRMDTPESVPRLFELGRAAAPRLISEDDFPAAFDDGLAGPE